MPDSYDYFLPFRYVWRSLSAIVHLTVGLLLVALAFPLLGYRQRRRMVHLWSRLFCAGLGVKPIHVGAPPPSGAALVVANHISWLDIFVINSWHACRFVAKSEVGAWPLIGWLSRHTGTLFISRQIRRDTGRIRHQMVHGLKRGHTLAVFPEGTTSGGESVLPFNPSLLQAALDTFAPVYTLTLRYRERDRATRIAAYIDDMSLAQSLHAILKARRLSVEVWIEDAIEHWPQDRRQLGEFCRAKMLDRLALAERAHSNCLGWKDACRNSAPSSKR